MKPLLLVLMMQMADGLGNLNSCRLKWNWGSNFLFSGEVCAGKVKLQACAAPQCLMSLQTSMSPLALSGSLLCLPLVGM